MYTDKCKNLFLETYELDWNKELLDNHLDGEEILFLEPNDNSAFLILPFTSFTDILTLYDKLKHSEIISYIEDMIEGTYRLHIYFDYPISNGNLIQVGAMLYKKMDIYPDLFYPATSLVAPLSTVESMDQKTKFLNMHKWNREKYKIPKRYTEKDTQVFFETIHKNDVKSLELLKDIKIEDHQSVVLNNLPIEFEKASVNQSYMKSFINNLVQPDNNYIPTPSIKLNKILNGGLRKNRVYGIVHLPGEGGTTFALNLMNHAANQKYYTLYFSASHTKQQINEYSLAQIEKIDSRLIEGRYWLNNNYNKHLELEKKVLNAAKKYHEIYSSYTAILPINQFTTPEIIEKAIRQFRKDYKIKFTIPILIIIDKLHDIPSGIQSFDTSHLTEPKISYVTKQLRRIAGDETATNEYDRGQNCTILCLLKTPKEALREKQKHGLLNLASIRDSFNTTEINTIFSLTSGYYQPSKDAKKSLLEKYGELNPSINLNTIYKEFPPREKRYSVYSILYVIRNQCGPENENILLLFERSFRKFNFLD